MAAGAVRRPARPAGASWRKCSSAPGGWQSRGAGVRLRLSGSVGAGPVDVRVPAIRLVLQPSEPLEGVRGRSSRARSVCWARSTGASSSCPCRCGGATATGRPMWAARCRPGLGTCMRRAPTRRAMSTRRRVLAARAGREPAPESHAVLAHVVHSRAAAAAALGAHDIPRSPRLWQRVETLRDMRTDCAHSKASCAADIGACARSRSGYSRGFPRTRCWRRDRGLPRRDGRRS